MALSRSFVASVVASVPRCNHVAARAGALMARQMEFSTNVFAESPATSFSGLYLNHYYKFLRREAADIPLFQDCLLSRQLLSKEQHLIFWHNYLLRTSNTLPMIALALSKASTDESRRLIKRNLRDEMGDESDPLHSELLNKSYGILAGKFNWPHASTAIADKSGYIMKSTREFLEKQHQLYKASEASSLGASFAQETLALPMLTNIKEFSEMHYKKCFTANEWEQFLEYFDAHLNGTEQEHAEDAGLSAKSIASAENREIILHAIEDFWSTQNALWRGLHAAIIQQHNLGPSQQRETSTSQIQR